MVANEVLLSKSAFIALARATFVPSKRCACKVCGKYKSLTQAHHVTPLAIQYDIGATKPNHDHVWLCPTHHAAVHILLGQAYSSQVSASRACAQVVYEMTQENMDEFRVLLSIKEMSKT